jgi:glycosyltransferase involved in cell wall biosynthesis
MSVCVAICSYGYGHLAAQAIESVLSQTRKPDQILLVDDGKHDGITTLGSRYNIETIIRVQNLGVVKNFNDILFKHVKTDKLLMLGADNYLHPQTIEKLTELDADIISYDITLIGTDVDEFRKQVPTHELTGYHIWRFSQGNINL